MAAKQLKDEKGEDRLVDRKRQSDNLVLPFATLKRALLGGTISIIDTAGGELS
ncbi:MAG TPA: hypothetical protein VG122_08185 [Gemmata sp.]|nr:hypothetical protein [Gemmata sp.]